MTEKEFNYEEDLAIDPAILDEEWLRHPQLFMQYSEELANAIEERDYAKDRLDVKKAELDADIRKDPDEYGISKVTEAVVAGTVAIEIAEATETDEFRAANKRVALLQGAVRAFEHRKKALENLVQLNIAGFFAGPKEPRDLPPGKRMRDIAEDNAGRKQRQKINRKRTRK